MSDKSEFEVRTFAVVVVARNHNPSLLNPDFLRIRHIVPEEYELAELPLTTPPVAVVKYKQGISITVEMEKLQVLETTAGEFPESPSAPNIVSKYVRTLPHVRYTGVGINWSGLLRKEDPGLWIRHRFLSKGPWRENRHKLVSSAVRLTYDLGDVQCNLSLASGQMFEEEALIPIVTIDVNYHHDITAYPGDEVVAGVIDRWKDRLDHFRTLVKDVLGVEA